MKDIVLSTAATVFCMFAVAFILMLMVDAIAHHAETQEKKYSQTCVVGESRIIWRKKGCL